MKFVYRYFPILAFATAMFLQSTPVDAGNPSRIPKSINLAGLSGGKLTASELHGKVTVIEFFAAWCEGCSAVMQKLEKISSGGSGQFKVVSVDETVSQARGYFKRKPEIKHLRKIAYFDKEASFAEQLGVESLPAVFVIGKDGRVIKKVHGHPTEQDYQQIRKLMGR